MWQDISLTLLEGLSSPSTTHVLPPSLLTTLFSPSFHFSHHHPSIFHISPLFLSPLLPSFFFTTSLPSVRFSSIHVSSIHIPFLPSFFFNPPCPSFRFFPPLMQLPSSFLPSISPSSVLHPTLTSPPPPHLQPQRGRWGEDWGWSRSGEWVNHFPPHWLCLPNTATAAGGGTLLPPPVSPPLPSLISPLPLPLPTLATAPLAATAVSNYRHYPVSELPPKMYISGWFLNKK